jgi:hypothetical protein
MLAGGDLEWIRQFDGDDIAPVAVGENVFVAGHKFINGNGIGYLRVYDPSGTEIWMRQITSTQSVRVAASAVDSGGIYVVGDVSGNLPGQTSAGFHDAFVIKYDYSGNEIWSRQFGSSRSDLAKDIAVHATGVYVLFEDLFFGNHLPQIAVSKLDSSGNSFWTRFPLDIERGEAISVDQSGIYTVGRSLNNTDSVLHRFDLDLQEIWTREMESSENSVAANDVAVNGPTIFVVGLAQGVLPGASAVGSGRIPDAFLQQYDVDGALVWTRQFVDGQANAVAVDDGAAYVTGYRTIDLDPNGEFTRPKNDAFVTKFSLGGSEIWRTEMDVSFGDGGSSIGIDANGVYVTGRNPGGNTLAKLEPGNIFGVAIDVKPTSAQNSISLSAQGAIAVAILSTSLADAEALDFDATQVGASSVIFAEALAFQSAWEDVDSDGDLDLILHFNVQDTNLDDMYADLVEDDLDADGVLDSNNQVVEASLFGKTLDGDALVGSDELHLFLSGRQLRDLLDELFG